MFALLLTFIFGLGIAYFTAQNTHGVTVILANYPLTGVPMYLIVIVSLLIGLFFGWIMNLMQSISSGFAIRGKEHIIKKTHDEVARLQTRVHELETENVELHGEHHEPHIKPEPTYETSVYRPSILTRLRNSFNPKPHPTLS